MFGCWAIIFGSSMGVHNLVTVFQCTIVTGSMSKIFGFYTVSCSWVITFDCVIDFNKLEAVFVCLIVRDFMSLLFGFFTVFNNFFSFLFFSFAFLTNNSYT